MGEIKVPGHVMNRQGVKKDKSKVEAILVIRAPSYVKEVQSFNGMVNYYSKFLPKIAEMMSPLYQLLKKGKEFVCSKECDECDLSPGCRRYFSV